MTFEEFILSKVIWKDTPHFDVLIKAVEQISEYPSSYLKDYNLSKQRISELYNKIFDLTNKPPNLGVNHYLYKLYRPESQNLKICSQCRQEKSLSEFFSNGYTPKGNKKYKSKCKTCHNSASKDRLRNIIESYFGSIKCKCCGYDKCVEAIEFHHIDSKSKDYNLSGLKTFSEELILKELNKGVLLCANCHRETHYGLHPEFLSQ